MLEGTQPIDCCGGCIGLSAGEMLALSKDVKHKPYGKNEAARLLVEPRGVMNMGM